MIDYVLREQEGRGDRMATRDLSPRTKWRCSDVSVTMVRSTPGVEVKLGTIDVRKNMRETMVPVRVSGSARRTRGGAASGRKRSSATLVRGVGPWDPGCRAGGVADRSSSTGMRFTRLMKSATKGVAEWWRFPPASPPGPHGRDLSLRSIAERHGLGPTVGDVDGGDAEAAQERVDLEAESVAQLGVEGRQRLSSSSARGRTASARARATRRR